MRVLCSEQQFVERMCGEQFQDVCAYVHTANHLHKVLLRAAQQPHVVKAQQLETACRYTQEVFPLMTTQYSNQCKCNTHMT